uniref:Uncharacterized protein n=1 Tax=Anguilla anguilla TaxID=7936 RepID=A0A0E9QRF0_ANGAN
MAWHIVCGTCSQINSLTLGNCNSCVNSYFRVW